MSYNPHKLAARLRRLATRLETVAKILRGSVAILNLQNFDETLDELDILIRQLRLVADSVKRPLPPIH